MPSFDLVDEPWIPCLLHSDGARVELGLRDVLTRAGDIREIVDASPLVTAALHRLLLAIMHRNFGPKDHDAWAALWRAEVFDAGILESYLDRWRPRLDLFHEERPFYQTAGISLDDARSVTRHFLVFGVGLNDTLFDHTSEVAPIAFTPAEAARYLLACQAFALGGLVSLQKHEDPKTFKSADAAPLAKSAVCLVKGENLFATLLLNSVQYDPSGGEPFDASSDDCPAWEWDGETRAEERLPRGYLDLLTWQSRRVRLSPEVHDHGQVRVPRVAIMKGFQFPDGFTRHGRETMLAFRRNTRAQRGQEPWPAVALRPDRVVWRDSLALFQSVEEQSARPKTLNWLNDLVRLRLLRRQQILPVDIYGAVTDRAKVLLWRHERLPLPLPLLETPALVAALERVLHDAERVGQLLQVGWLETQSSNGPKKVPTPLLVLGQALVGTRERQRPEDIVRHLAPARAYWSRLDLPFRQLLIELPEDCSSDGDGEESYGSTVRPRWRETLRRTARDAFAEATSGLDESPRSLRGVGLAERELSRWLSRYLGPGQLDQGGAA